LNNAPAIDDAEPRDELDLRR